MKLNPTDQKLIRRFGMTLLFLSLFVCLALLVLFNLDNSIGTHPEFGKIYETTAFDLNAGRSNPVGQFLRRHLPPRILRSRHFPAYFKDQPKFLELKEVPLEWSIGGTNTGWLYFWGGLRRPKTISRWEFAPSTFTNLYTVTATSLPAQFYSATDSNVPRAFGGNSNTNAIYVAQGQIVFARRTDATNKVYVLKLENQQGNSLLVHYCVTVLP